MEKMDATNEKLKRKINYAQSLLRSLNRPLRRLGVACDPGNLTEKLSKVTTTADLHQTAKDLDDDSAPGDMIDYLAVVEQRIIDILQFHQAFMQNHNPNSAKWKKRRNGPHVERGTLAKSLAQQQERIIGEMVKRFPKEKFERDYRGSSEQRLTRAQLESMVKSEMETSMSKEEREIRNFLAEEERQSRETTSRSRKRTSAM
jgi:hypothetical protein